MPQSFCQVDAHLIFSTKDRIPMLDTQIRGRRHARQLGVSYGNARIVRSHYCR